jgi:hypothetical protein
VADVYNNFAEFEKDVIKNWDSIKQVKPKWYSSNGLDQDFEIDDAYNLYANTKGSSLREMLLGDMQIRSELELLRNFGTTSGSETSMERGTLYGSKNNKIKVDHVSETIRQRLTTKKKQDTGNSTLSYKELQEVEQDLKLVQIELIRKGSVLNDGYWWPFKNDTWIIGAVHGLKVFHLATTDGVIDDALIWDKKSNRARMLGRELIGLYTFGYRRVTAFFVDKITNEKKPDGDFRKSVGVILAPQDGKAAMGANYGDYFLAVSNFKSFDDIYDAILDAGTAVDMEKYDLSKI